MDPADDPFNTSPPVRLHPVPLASVAQTAQSVLLTSFQNTACKYKFSNFHLSSKFDQIIGQMITNVVCVAGSMQVNCAYIKTQEYTENWVNTHRII